MGMESRSPKHKDPRSCLLRAKEYLYRKKHIAVLSLLLIFYTLPLQSNILLTPPSPITEQDIATLPQTWDARFCFPTGQLFFKYEQGTSSFVLELNDISTLRPEEQAQCIPMFFGEKTSFVFHYGTLPLSSFNQLGETLTSESPYYFIEPRDFERQELQQIPQELSGQHVATYIKNKKIVFYTGAGISIAGGVHDMRGLTKALLIDFNDFPLSVHEMITHPEMVVKAFDQFCYAAFNNPPTPAHYALTSLAHCMKCQVITENFDFLHERTGYRPYNIQADKLQREVTPQDLQEIDTVVCIGLSHDDRGFLAWYKHHNPNGIIIAIDLKKPSYLGSEDILVQSDLQYLLPYLYQQIDQQ